MYSNIGLSFHETVPLKYILFSIFMKTRNKPGPFNEIEKFDDVVRGNVGNFNL